MKRVQYTGSNANFTDTVVRRSWVLGENYITDDLTAEALIAAGNFKDTTGNSFALGIGAAASRTLAASDNGKVIPVTAVGLTLTLPSDASVDSVDLPITVSNANVTFQAPAGVSVNGSAAGGAANFAAPAIYSTLRLRRVTSASYVVSG